MISSSLVSTLTPKSYQFDEKEKEKEKEGEGSVHVSFGVRRIRKEKEKGMLQTACFTHTQQQVLYRLDSNV